MSTIRLGCALQSAACFGALLFSPSSSAAVSLNTDAHACVTPNGGTGVGCILDNTAPTGNVSQTSSGTNSTGVPFTSNASAFADGSNFGELRMSGSAAITGGAQADGYGQILINDFHNFSAAGLSGQARNYWRHTYSDGTGPGAGSALDLYYDVAQTDFDSFSSHCEINLAFTACANTFGLFSFDNPFTWGVDDPLLIQFNAHAQVVGERAVRRVCLEVARHFGSRWKQDDGESSERTLGRRTSRRIMPTLQEPMS